MLDAQAVTKHQHSIRAKSRIGGMKDAIEGASGRGEMQRTLAAAPASPCIGFLTQDSCHNALLLLCECAAAELINSPCISRPLLCQALQPVGFRLPSVALQAEQRLRYGSGTL
jgi:hypothetical protein